MKNWSDSPFPQTVPLDAVSSYRESDVIARDNGESSVIYEPPGHRGWLVKLYRPEVQIDHRTLARLIALPGGMPSGDLAIVDRGTAWPVSRVMSGYRTVGTIMAKASQEFFWDVELLGGRTKRRIIDIDMLANPEERMRKLGLPVPSDTSRLASLREIVAVAELFERHSVVYGDWSFANTFWSPKTQRILVIDMDTSGIGTGTLLQTPNWEDPLVPSRQPLTTYADRYKVALLVARTMTGARTGRIEAVDALERRHPDHHALIDVLRRCITARSAEQRPSLTDLLQAMDSPHAPPQTDGPNVTGMRPWQPGGRSTAAPRPLQPPPVSPPAPVDPLMALYSTRQQPSAPTGNPAPRPPVRAAVNIPTPAGTPSATPPNGDGLGHRAWAGLITIAILIVIAFAIFMTLAV